MQLAPPRRRDRRPTRVVRIAHRRWSRLPDGRLPLRQGLHKLGTSTQADYWCGRSSTATSSDVTRRPPSRRSRSTTWRLLAGTRLTLAAAWDEREQPRRRLAVADARHLVFVRTGSEVSIDEGGCSSTRARARCACRSSRPGRQQAHRRLPQSRQRRAAGAVVTMPDRRGHGDAHFWRLSGKRPSLRSRPA